MPRKTCVAEDGHGGWRTDVFVAGALDISRTMAARLCADGHVTRHGQSVDKKDKVRPGDIYDMFLPEAEEETARPQDIALDILYEDADLIVLNKPRGLVVHPAPGHVDGTLVNALLHHCGDDLSGIGGVKRPGIVHRLDKDTSGVMLAAKNDAAHAALSAALANRQIARTYEAVVRGRITRDTGRIDAPIGRDPRNRKRMAVVVTGRPAATRFSVLQRYECATLVLCALETGRTHQIRAHMKYIGHPVWGDALYGGGQSPLLDGQCLHAAQLSFTHPASGACMTFTAPRPADFEAVLTSLA